MIKNETLKEIEKCEPKRQTALMYVVENCSSYKVSHTTENEHWLCGSVIVTHWNHDTGYTTKYKGVRYPDNFESWSFHNDKLASEAFKSQHDIGIDARGLSQKEVLTISPDELRRRLYND
jgi:hypothetical protein